MLFGDIDIIGHRRARHNSAIALFVLTFSKNWKWIYLVFMPLHRTEGAGGIMFPGCPSVRPDVCPDFFVYAIYNSSITWWNFIKLGQKVKLDVTINWLDLGWNPPNVKGQRSIWSKYAISTSFTRNLKNSWMDFHQT